MDAIRAIGISTYIAIATCIGDTETIGNKTEEVGADGEVEVEGLVREETLGVGSSFLSKNVVVEY